MALIGHCNQCQGKMLVENLQVRMVIDLKKIMLVILWNTIIIIWSGLLVVLHSLPDIHLTDFVK